MKNFLFLQSDTDLNESIKCLNGDLKKVYTSSYGSFFLASSDKQLFISDDDFLLYFEGYSKLEFENESFSSNSPDFLNRVKDVYFSIGRDFKALIGKISGVFSILIVDPEKDNVCTANDYFNHNKTYFKSNQLNTIITNNFAFLSIFKNTTEKLDIDRNALSLLMRHNCVPAPYTIYKDVFKLAVGQFVIFVPGCSAQVSSYKTIADFMSNKLVDSNHTESSVIDMVENSISKAIDFTLEKYGSSPTGAFLSGGVDSSLVSAILSSKVGALQTYSLGFKDPLYDESALASEMSKNIKADHKVLYYDSSDVLRVVKKLPDIYPEPFADSSQIPTYLMEEFAPSGTLIFAGDGGDEVFGGYNRYISANKIWSKFKYLPLSLRRVFSNMILKYPPVKWDMIFEKLYAITPKRFHLSQSGDKLHKLASILPHQTGYEFYRELTSHWKAPEQVVLGATEPLTLLTNEDAWPDVDTFEEWMMAMDLQTYLPDDGVVKVNLAAKYNNIAVFSPFLNEDVIKLAFSLPMHYKINKGIGKWVLREIQKRYYPASLLDQPKKGFGIPLDKLLRDELKSWANDLLDKDRLKEEGYFDSQIVDNVWQEHLSGEVNNQYLLWDILMFQAWKEKYC